MDKEQSKQIEVNQGNIEILHVKLLSDICQQLKRIADVLETSLKDK